jgi:hypothetical protein
MRLIVSIITDVASVKFVCTEAENLPVAIAEECCIAILINQIGAARKIGGLFSLNLIAPKSGCCKALHLNDEFEFTKSSGKIQCCLLCGVISFCHRATLVFLIILIVD